MDDGRDGLTRRGALKYGGTIAVGGLLAGCSESSGSGGTTTAQSTTAETTTEETTTAGETTATETTEQTTTAESRSYTVEMAPVGEVTFESVPETWESYFPGYVDMGVALGKADGLTAVGVKSRYYTRYYDELDGVSVDKSSLTQLYDEGIDAELYYELDNDVHLTDPEWLLQNSFFGLDETAVDNIGGSVGPFVGNTIFRRTDPWHDYRYYTMYEAFEKVAAVFQREERYAALKSLHDDMIAGVQADLPAADARPNGLLCFAGSDEPETFSPYRLTDKGTNKKHFRDLGVGDALSGTGIDGLSTKDRGKIDYETMLSVDPEMLFVRGHENKSRQEFEDTVVSFMKEHSVAGSLTAVQNDDVYRGGPVYQGPIQNLFLTERFASLLYPDTYDGELFDRDEVASIVTGSES